MEKKKETKIKFFTRMERFSPIAMHAEFNISIEFKGGEQPIEPCKRFVGYETSKAKSNTHIHQKLNQIHTYIKIICFFLMYVCI